MQTEPIQLSSNRDHQAVDKGDNEYSIDFKLKIINNQIEELKEKEVKRLKDMFCENPMENENDSNKDILRRIFLCLFGLKETQKIMNALLNERKEFKAKFIKKSTRSNSDPNKLKSSLNLLHSPIKKDEQKLNNATNIDSSRITHRQIFSDYSDVNFGYNFLFNKAPQLQNKYPNSTFLKFNLRRNSSSFVFKH